MNRKYRVLSWILCLLVCLLPLVSCKENSGEDLQTSTPESESRQELPSGKDPDPEPPTPSNEKTYRLAEVADRIKPIGRSDWSGDALLCDFTASGFEVNVNASGTLKMTLDATAQTYFTVFVDGIRKHNRISVPAGENVEVELTDFAAAGEHSIRVLKQTEAKNSLCLIRALTVEGTVSERPADRDLLIEFVGDDIFCGFGNYLCYAGTPEPGSAQYQDGTNALPFLAAEALNSDCSVVSFSGIGLASGTISYSMAEAYAKRSYLRDAETGYSFSRTPDLVVIGLGSIDALNREQITKEAFKDEVKHLITEIRRLNGRDVPIVWTYGMMNDACMDWAKDAIDELGGEDNWLFLCELDQNTDGGDGRPNDTAHQSAAGMLSTLIRKKRWAELTGVPTKFLNWTDLPVLWL